MRNLDNLNTTKELIKRCVVRWKTEEENEVRLNFFTEYFGTWLEQIPNEYREEVIKLIDRFDYFSRKNVNQGLEDLHKELVEEIKKDLENTIYSFIVSSDGQSNSSNDYWHEYKSINELKKQKCILDLGSTEIKWDRVKNIVFIDDFSGTGQSFYDELEKHKNIFEGKTIIFITICIMEEAIENIKEYCQKNNLTIKFLYIKKQDKAFVQKSDYESKKAITEMSKKIGIIDYKEDKIMGWKDTESLVAFYNNTPNNTIKFLRYESKDYFSIFPRGERLSVVRPSIDKLKGDRKQRRRDNYNNQCAYEVYNE